jgi:ATP-binding cassette, subfamily B, bacterial
MIKGSFHQYWTLLLNYLKPQGGKVLLLAGFLFGTIGLQLVIPQILRRFIDTATSGGPQESLTQAALLFMGVVLVGQLCHALAAYFSAEVGWTATNLLRADLTLHCLKLDLSFHHAHPSGEMIERLDGDINALFRFFSQFVVRIMGNSLLLVGILIVLFGEDWRIGLTLTLYIGLALTALLRLQGIAVPHFRAFRATVGELSGFWEERLTATEDIQAVGATAYVMQGSFLRLRLLLQRGRRAQVLFRAFIGSGAAVFVWGNTLAFVVAAFLYSEGLLTLGTVYLVLHYTNLLSRNLMEITDELNELQQATAGIERINELQLTPAKIQDGPGVCLPTGPLTVEFQQVAFQYGPGVPVLHNISFRLEAGRVLGILGRTGSGKTTLTRLLTRFYDPEQGLICLGDVELRQARLADLRERIGVVTQEVQLFHGALRDNLTFFKPHISDGQILETLQALGLEGWYRSLPAGLETNLLAGANSLSAGEAQLLAFARVFLRDPGLIILDEASSRLDPATEGLIQQAIQRLLRNRTGLIIAHRLKTVECADDILLLEGGRIREYGPYQQLAADPKSAFAGLLRLGGEEVWR